MSNDMPFQLIAWIRRDQEERRLHALAMTKRNYRDDDEFMRLISFLIRDWNKLKTNDKLFVKSLQARHEAGLNFSGKQRSAITALWLRISA